MNEIKERPIIFSSEMVRAILDNRKTQTRRVIKPQPCVSHYGVTWTKQGRTTVYGAMLADWDYSHWDEGKPASQSMINRCPYGKPGDRLWVKETWCPVDDTEYDGEKWVDYRATPRYTEPGVSHPAWRLSMFARNEYRIFLRRTQKLKELMF